MTALLVGIGRKAWGYVLLAGAAGLFLLNVYLKGKSDARAAHDRQSLDNLRERNRTDEKIRNLPPDRVRRDLADWVRDGE